MPQNEVQRHLAEGSVGLGQVLLHLRGFALGVHAFLAAPIGQTGLQHLDGLARAAVGQQGPAVGRADPAAGRGPRPSALLTFLARQGLHRVPGECGGLIARSAYTANRNPVGVVAPSFVTGDLLTECILNALIGFRLNVSNVTNKLYAESLCTGHYVPGLSRNVHVTRTARC